MKNARVILCGIVLVMLSGCASKGNPPVSTAPATPSGTVIIPPESPKLTQIRVEPLQLTNMPTGEVTAPGKIEVNPNRISRVPLPVAGRVTEVKVKLGDSVT